MSGEDFNPDWTVHPGVTLGEAVREKGFTQAAFAKACGISEKHLSRIITGDNLYSARLAIAFSRHLGASPRFWWNLRNNYELDLALGRKDVARSSGEALPNG